MNANATYTDIETALENKLGAAATDAMMEALIGEGQLRDFTKAPLATVVEVMTGEKPKSRATKDDLIAAIHDAQERMAKAEQDQSCVRCHNAPGDEDNGGLCDACAEDEYQARIHPETGDPEYIEAHKNVEALNEALATVNEALEDAPPTDSLLDAMVQDATPARCPACGLDVLPDGTCSNPGCGDADAPLDDVAARGPLGTRKRCPDCGCRVDNGHCTNRSCEEDSGAPVAAKDAETYTEAKSTAEANGVPAAIAEHIAKDAVEDAKPKPTAKPKARKTGATFCNSWFGTSDKVTLVDGKVASCTAHDGEQVLLPEAPATLTLEDAQDLHEAVTGRPCRRKVQGDVIYRINSYLRGKDARPAREPSKASKVRQLVKDLAALVTDQGANPEMLDHLEDLVARAKDLA